MSENSIKAFLKSIRIEWKEVAHLSEIIEELRTSMLPSAVRYDKEHVQTSVDPDPDFDAMERIFKYEKIMRKLKMNLLEKYERAAEMIMQLEKSEHRQLIYLYYLHAKRLRWTEVAEKMNLTERRVYQLHDEAIHILETLQ